MKTLLSLAVAAAWLLLVVAILGHVAVSGINLGVTVHQVLNGAATIALALLNLARAIVEQVRQ